MLRRTGFVLLVFVLSFSCISTVFAWDSVDADTAMKLEKHGGFIGYRQLKEDLPFSYRDKKMHWTCDEEEFNLAREKEAERYDYWCAEAAFSFGSGESVERSSTLGNGVIAHERFHDLVILPVHMNEAGAEIAYTVAESKTRREMLAGLRELLFDALESNRRYDQQVLFYEKYHKGQIGWREFLKERCDNPVALSFFHTYTYYIPLMVRLFIALDCNMERFEEELQNLPHEGCRVPRDIMRLSFEEARQREIKLEKKINEIIERCEKKSR